MAILLRVLDNKWFRRGLIAVVLIVGLIVGGRWYLGYYIDSHLYKDLGPERYADLQRFLDSPLSIPDEWYEVEPFPDDLIELDREFQAEWEPISQSYFDDLREFKGLPLAAKLSEGEELTENETKIIGNFLNKYSSSMETFCRVVSHPQYQWDAWNSNLFDHSEDKYLLILRLAEYQAFLASAQAREGKWDESFYTVLLGMRTAIRHPAIRSIERERISICLGQASRPVPAIVSGCTNAELLVKTLQEINRLAPLVNPEQVSGSDVSDLVSLLRKSKRMGLPVDFHPGMTGRQIVRQGYDISRYCPRTPGLAPGDILSEIDAQKSNLVSRMGQSLEFIRKNREYRRTHSQSLASSPVSASSDLWFQWNDLQDIAEGIGLFGKTEEVVVYFVNERYSIFSDVNENIAAFDLARLSLASWIVELETGKKPTDASVFIPRFFPEPLTDPESGKPYRWDEVIEQFVRPGE